MRAGSEHWGKFVCPEFPIATLELVLPGDPVVPVKNVRCLSPVSSSRRRRLAMWLMLGCVSSSPMVNGGVCAADDLDWGNGLSFSAPTSNAGSPALSSPMTDGEHSLNGDAKVPTFRPTDSVNSVLGLRGGRADWDGGKTGPAGTSIQLLPAERPPAPKPQPTAEASAQLRPAAPAPAQPTISTPNFVTRDNAELRGMHRTWQPAVPTFQAPTNELVLRPVAPDVDATPAPQRDLSAPRALLQPPQQIATQAPPPSQFAPGATPTQIPNLATGPNARTVSDRRLFPAWMSPRSTTPTQTAATRATPNRVSTSDRSYNQPEVHSQGPSVGWQPRGQSIPPQPLRDPIPMSVTTPMRSDPMPSVTTRTPAPISRLPESTTGLPETTTRLGTVPRNNEPVGSGVSPSPVIANPPRLLSPVQRMPSLDALPDGPASMDIPSRVDLDENLSEDLNESLELETLDGDESELDASELSLGAPAASSQLPELSSAKTTDVNEGNNEGDMSGPLAADDSEGKDPDELESDSALVELLQSPNATTPSVTAKAQPSEEKDSQPELSVTRIKPLVINPVGPLKPIDEKADLRDVHDDASREVAGSSRRSDSARDLSDRGLSDTRAEDRSAADGSERIASLPADRLADLDATGRPKTYSGRGAVANLDPAIQRLQRPILQTLRSFHARTEKADSRSNWGMMHAIMVYGADTRIIARRRNYSAIAWIAGNNVCRGNRLMTTERGKIKIREGTGLQGHQAQFLCVLSLAGVPSNYPLYADNQKFTVEDLVQVEAAACEEGKELTFTLIGLAHYLDTDATWIGVGGERWNFDRLIAAELNEPIVGAACGGTHRLMGFAHALRKRRLEGEPIDGQWKRAEDFLNDFTKYTYSMQNRDGSFSTNWFESREDNGVLQRKVQTTGHMLEFLLTHLPDEDLVDPHVVNAVRFITNSMGRVELDDAGVGYRGHALRSLAMFHRRVYGTAPDYPQGNVASERTHQQRRR